MNFLIEVVTLLGSLSSIAQLLYALYYAIKKQK